MRTDYKFWYIKRDDDGFITEAAVRFYEGDVTTELEKDTSLNLVPITRFRRSKRLGSSDVPHINVGFIKDARGKDAAVYTSESFGRIKTDEELRTFLNREISKDTKRVAINEQKI